MYIFIILFCQNNKAFPLGSWMLRSTGGFEHIVLSNHACQVERHMGKGLMCCFTPPCIKENWRPLLPTIPCLILTRGRLPGDQKALKKSTWSVILSVPNSLLILPSALPRMHQTWCSYWRNSNKKPGKDPCLCGTVFLQEEVDNDYNK